MQFYCNFFTYLTYCLQKKKKNGKQVWVCVREKEYKMDYIDYILTITLSLV